MTRAKLWLIIVGTVFGQRIGFFFAELAIRCLEGLPDPPSKQILEQRIKLSIAREENAKLWRDWRNR